MDEQAQKYWKPITIIGILNLVSISSRKLVCIQYCQNSMGNYVLEGFFFLGNGSSNQVKNFPKITQLVGDTK